MDAFAASVVLASPDGREARLAPGDRIGRLPSVELWIDDATISEVHAVISLREGGLLWMLGLRGRLRVEGALVAEVCLAPGLEVELAPQVAVQVLEVVVPEVLLAIEGPDLPRQILHGTSSLLLRPTPTLIARYVEDAEAHLWCDGRSFRWRPRGGLAQPLRPGELIKVSGHTLTVVTVPRPEAGASPTDAVHGVRPALRLVAAYETVTVFRRVADGEDPVPLVLQGVPARIVSEIISRGGTAPWREVAGQIWPRDPAGPLLRRRWDIALVRVRAKFKASGLPSELLQMRDGGQVSIALEESDVIEDRT